MQPSHQSCPTSVCLLAYFLTMSLTPQLMRWLMFSNLIPLDVFFFSLSLTVLPRWVTISPVNFPSHSRGNQPQIFSGLLKTSRGGCEEKKKKSSFGFGTSFLAFTFTSHINQEMKIISLWISPERFPKCCVITTLSSLHALFSMRSGSNPKDVKMLSMENCHSCK